MVMMITTTAISPARYTRIHSRRPKKVRRIAAVMKLGSSRRSSSRFALAVAADVGDGYIGHGSAACELPEIAPLQEQHRRPCFLPPWRKYLRRRRFLHHLRGGLRMVGSAYLRFLFFVAFQGANSLNSASSAPAAADDDDVATIAGAVV